MRGASYPPNESEVFNMLTSDGCDNGLKEGKLVEVCRVVMPLCFFQY